jgi:hypothetical protein
LLLFPEIRWTSALMAYRRVSTFQVSGPYPYPYLRTLKLSISSTTTLDLTL